MSSKMILCMLTLAAFMAPVCGQVQGTSSTGHNSMAWTVTNEDGEVTDIGLIGTGAIYQNGALILDSTEPEGSKILTPTSASAIFWNNRGWDLVQQGKYYDAILAYDNATTLDPSFAMAWNNKGFALFALGLNYNQDRYSGDAGDFLYLEATKAFLKAIELEPENPMGWHNVGIILRNLGEYNLAIEYQERAIQLDYQFANAWYEKGLDLEALGRISEANAAYAQAQTIRITS